MCSLRLVFQEALLESYRCTQGVDKEPALLRAQSQQHVLHMEMLLQKQMEQQRAAESIFEDTPLVRNKWGTYRPDMPQYLADISIHRARVMLEDYSQYQPAEYLRSPSVSAGLGTVVLVGMLRCRHFKVSEAALRKGVAATTEQLLVEQGFSSSGVGAALPTAGIMNWSGDSDVSASCSEKYATDGASSNSNLSNLHATILREAFHSQRMECSTNSSRAQGQAAGEISNAAASPSSALAGSDTDDGPSMKVHPWTDGGAASSMRRSPQTESAGAEAVASPSSSYRRAWQAQAQEDAGGAADSSVSDWVRQYGYLQVVLGDVHLVLLDPTTLKHTATIHISALSKIAPSGSLLNGIDVMDVFGLSWQLIPEGIDEADNRDLPRTWLRTLGALALPHTEVVYIIRSGFLMKRGRVNKAFRQRWFVLSTDFKLRYYKDDVMMGGWKGEIDLTMLAETVNDGKPIVRFNREVVICMGAMKRDWILQAADNEEAECWIIALHDLLATLSERRQFGGQQTGDRRSDQEADVAVKGFVLHRHTEVDEDDDDDDDDEDD